MQEVLHDLPRPNKQLLDTIRDISLHEHVCLLYRDKDEGLASAGAFIQAGLEQNDQCVYVADDNAVADVVKALTQRGINVDAALETQQLIIGTKQETYLLDGYFDPDQAIAFFAQASREAQSSRFRAVRGCAEMTWQLGGEPGTDRLLEYESKMNSELFPNNNVLGVCQFNLSSFSPWIIREVIYTHPVVIVGGLVCVNLYYKSPGVYRPRVSSENAELDIKRMLKEIFAFAKIRYNLV